MRRHGKRFQQAAKQVDQSKTHPLETAVQMLQQLPAAKFNETVELSASLNVDPEKSDQSVRGTVLLPHGTGKSCRVLVFCKGEQEILAKQAGAEFTGGADLIAKVQDGWLDFDVVVASPEMMRDVSKLGKVLGPRGLMPNPKAGTVTTDIPKAVRELKQGKIEFKMDKLGNLHLSIGKRSFKPEELAANGRAALGAIARAKPAAVKGRLLRRVAISSTMSPSVPVSTEGLEETLE